MKVLNLRTLKPIDRDAIVKSVTKTHRCVVVEEGWPQSGVGAGAHHDVDRLSGVCLILVTKAHRCVVVEEGWPQSGVGAGAEQHLHNSCCGTRQQRQRQRCFLAASASQAARQPPQPC